MTDRLRTAALIRPDRTSRSWTAEYDEPDRLDDLDQLFRGCMVTRHVQSGSVLPENIAEFSELLANYSAYVNEMIERRWHMTLIDRVVSELRSRVEYLENHQTLVVPVETFADEGFEVVRPFNVVIEPAGDDFTATLYDANVSASGETTEEAVLNLKEMLLETIELFETGVSLGAAMQKQKNVLKSLIRRKQVSPK